MHSLEGLIFLLVIVFYILRGIYRAIKSVFLALRKALVPSRAMTAEQARRAAQEQMRQSTPSQQARPPQSRPAPQRARRPEAGGPAVTDAATSGQFRTQVAQIEAQESPGGPGSDQPPGNATENVPPLFRGGDDLVRAVILQEVLGKPLSQRRRGMPYKQPTPNSPQ